MENANKLQEQIYLNHLKHLHSNIPSQKINSSEVPNNLFEQKNVDPNYFNYLPSKSIKEIEKEVIDAKVYIIR